MLGVGESSASWPAYGLASGNINGRNVLTREIRPCGYLLMIHFNVAGVVGWIMLLLAVAFDIGYPDVGVEGNDFGQEFYVLFCQATSIGRTSERRICPRIVECGSAVHRTADHIDIQSGAHIGVVAHMGCDHDIGRGLIWSERAKRQQQGDKLIAWFEASDSQRVARSIGCQVMDDRAVALDELLKRLQILA